MNAFTFLEIYQRLQKGIMFDKLVDLGYATISYCATYDSNFWNNAICEESLSDKQISEVENSFKKLARKSTFYLEHTEKLNSFISRLTAHGYKKSFEDCWQFWKGEKKIDSKHFTSVKSVENEKDLKIFLETMDKCYQNNDPQNPYGEVGEDYLRLAKKAWETNHASNKIEYFIVYKENDPVAVSTLTNFEKIGYISNVASLKSVRGQGFGKAATLYCVKKSIENKNTEHCLATEEGEYPNDFYNKIGFETRFKVTAFTKD